MKTTCVQKLGVYGLVLSCALFQAGSVGATESGFLEEVIVTAQKREQSLRDVPSSVVALNAEALRKSNITEFAGLARVTSGVELSSLSDGFAKTVRIRGVGTDTFSLSVDPSVGIFLDEVALVDIGAAFNNLLDIQQIEVLKGPQSTLFGKGVSSGAITLTTMAPSTDAPEAYVEGNFGNLDLQEYYLGGNLPMGDHFALRASVYSSEIDGEVKNVTTGNKLSPYDKWGGRIRAAWDVSDSLSMTLGYEYHDVETSSIPYTTIEYGDLPQTLAADDPNTSLLLFDPFDRKTQSISEIDRDTETEIASLTIDWALDEQWSIKSITGAQDWVQDSARGSTTTSPFPTTPSNGIFDKDAFSQELRLSYSSDRWDSIIGVFYSETEQDSLTDIAFPLAVLSTDAWAPGLPATSTYIRTALHIPNVSEVKDWAIFTHNTYSFDSGWDVVFGLRYSQVEKEVVTAQQLGVGEFEDIHVSDPTNVIINSVVPLPVSNWDIPTQKDDWDAITGGLKFVYAISDSVSAYIGFERGFKPGGFNSVQDDGTGAGYVIAKSFDEETADNYEAGIKGLFFDSRLMTNVAVFHQKYDDYQVSVPDEVTFTRFENAAEVEVEGVELDFEWAVVPSLRVGGNVSYIDAQYVDYANASCIRPQYAAIACTDNGVQDLSGEQLHLTSPWTAFSHVTWSGEFSNGVSWYLRGEASYRDKRTFLPDLDPATEEGSYSLLNASMGLSGAKWDIVLWGKNLTDEEYLVDITNGFDASNTGFVPTATEGLRVNAGAQRTYGIRLRYSM